MHDKWQFVVQLPVTQDMLFDIRCLAGVKDVYGEGALLTIIPENKSVRFDAFHRWLSCYLKQKHELKNRFSE
ncbi:MAG TPA: hypothetical protein VHP36_03805 [Chitinispirillaceae bacterium]|nr:hypothetical protein [Chitinispirillaceae bacterium]